MNNQHGMTLIVKTITRLTVGLIFMYGIYIIIHGHISPGGGFAGGVIVALSFIHLTLAYGKDAALEKLSTAKASIIESTGMLVFLSIALLGFIGGYFFLNFFHHKGEPFKLISAGIIPLCNIAIALEVACGLFLVFTALILFHFYLKNKEKV